MKALKSHICGAGFLKHLHFEDLATNLDSSDVAVAALSLLQNPLAYCVLTYDYLQHKQRPPTKLRIQKEPSLKQI